jgi:hypothetical protein
MAAPPGAGVTRPRTSPATVLRDGLMIAVAALAYIGVRAVSEGRAETAADNARDLARLEQELGMAWEAAVGPGGLEPG